MNKTLGLIHNALHLAQVKVVARQDAPACRFDDDGMPQKHFKLMDHVPEVVSCRGLGFNDCLKVFQLFTQVLFPGLVR